jgi:hypothetical protein
MEENIKTIFNPEEIGCELVDLMCMAQDRVQ